MSQLILAGAAFAVAALTTTGARRYARWRLRKRFAAVLDVIADSP